MHTQTAAVAAKPRWKEGKKMNKAASEIERDSVDWSINRSRRSHYS